MNQLILKALKNTTPVTFNYGAVNTSVTTLELDVIGGDAEQRLLVETLLKQMPAHLLNGLEQIQFLDKAPARFSNSSVLYMEPSTILICSNLFKQEPPQKQKYLFYQALGYHVNQLNKNKYSDTLEWTHSVWTIEKQFDTYGTLQDSSQFITPNAATSPEEDFVDSFAMYFINPTAVELYNQNSPQRLELLRDCVEGK